MLVDGQFYDSYAMALLHDMNPAQSAKCGHRPEQPLLLHHDFAAGAN